MCVEYRKQQIVHVILNSVKSVNLEYYSITISITHKVSQMRSFPISPYYILSRLCVRFSCFVFFFRLKRYIVRKCSSSAVSFEQSMQ